MFPHLAGALRMLSSANSLNKERKNTAFCVAQVAPAEYKTWDPIQVRRILFVRGGVSLLVVQQLVAKAWQTKQTTNKDFCLNCLFIFFRLPENKYKYNHWTSCCLTHKRALPGHYAVICTQSLAKQERVGVIVAQRTMKQVEWWK